MIMKLHHGETIKPIPDYEGEYSITSHGRVYSHERKDSLDRRIMGRFLSQKKNRKDGYDFVSLYRDGDEKHYLVHRLVAIGFIDNPDQKPEVNHNDGIKANNRDTNLEWVTRTENEHHSALNGLNHTSDYHGVHYTSDTRYKSRWRAQIWLSGKTKILGHFKTAREAVMVYNKYVVDNNLPHLLNEV